MVILDEGSRIVDLNAIRIAGVYDHVGWAADCWRVRVPYDSYRKGAPIQVAAVILDLASKRIGAEIEEAAGRRHAGNRGGAEPAVAGYDRRWVLYRLVVAARPDGHVGWTADGYDGMSGACRNGQPHTHAQE